MYSRREFGKFALLSLPFSLAISAGSSKVNGVRIGVQSYSFRTLSLDDAIKAMKTIGIGECELFSGHVEPRPNMGGMQMGPPPGGARPQPPTPEQQAARREAMAKAAEETKKWRLSVGMDHFTKIKDQFKTAGIVIQAYNLSFNDRFSDEEIDRGFLMAKALGAKFITASSTLKAAKRVAPFADKHKMMVAMHGHSNLKDPNEFAKPESFEAAMAMSKYFGVNLDIGHFFAAGYDPIPFIEKYHARISNLHIKDRKKDDGPNMVWGEGDTPIKPVLQFLKSKKYNIPANIEFEYRGEDSVAEVKKCFEYIKGALA